MFVRCRLASRRKATEMRRLLLSSSLSRVGIGKELIMIQTSCLKRLVISHYAVVRTEKASKSLCLPSTIGVFHFLRFLQIWWLRLLVGDIASLTYGFGSGVVQFGIGNDHQNKVFNRKSEAK